MKITLFVTAAGASPVRRYLDGLSSGEAARITAALIDIEEHGLVGSVVHLRPIAGKLWELKVDRHRVFYVVVRGPQMVLLHAYSKQTRKAPRREIDLAVLRMREVLGDE